MPMRSYWNAIEPSVYLTLFSWLAPFKEGRFILRNFATEVDPKYAHPTYLGHVVLTPVVKIVDHIIDMCYMEEILVNPAKIIRNNKLRHQATCYIAGRYLKSLIYDTETRYDDEPEGTVEDEELSGEEISRLEGATQVLLNLPKEFQRWNKNYKKNESESIKFSLGDKGTNMKTQNLTRPMNVNWSIHQSFKKCLFQKEVKSRGKKAPAQNETNLALTLTNSWDPFYITQKIMQNKFIIEDSDWNNEKPTLYQNGQESIGKSRGSTALASKAINDTPNYREAEENDDSNEPSDYSAPEDEEPEEEKRAETTTKTKDKKQKKSNKRKHNEINNAVTEELLTIIKKRVIVYIPRKLRQSLKIDVMCNNLAKDMKAFIETMENNGNDSES
jgi:hypothetical protein